jgi:hypothetical protein
MGWEWQNASREEKVRWLLRGRPKEREQIRDEVDEDILTFCARRMTCTNGEGRRED